jgi:hypothetical protein
VTEMSFDDFQLPSQTNAEVGAGAKYPSLDQLKGRLVWLRPTDVRYNSTTPLRKDPHTQVTVEIAFLDGAPIDRVLNKHGQSTAVLNPPIQPGQVQAGRFINQTWFTKRLASKVGQAGYVGLLGRLNMQPGQGTNTFWALDDPSPSDLAMAKQWWTWKNASPEQALYRPIIEQPAPQQYAPAPAAQQQYAQPAPQQAPAPSPFAPAAQQQYAQPAPQTAAQQQPAQPAPSPFAPAQQQQYAQPAPQQPAPSPFAPVAQQQYAQPAPQAPAQQPAPQQQTAPASPLPWEN